MRKHIHKLLKSRVVLYFFAAGTATAVDIGMYFISYNFLFKKEDVHFFNYIFSAPSLALLISYSCGLLINFSISKFLVFKESEVRTHKQFFRFVMVALAVFVANYYLLNFLVRVLHWYPTIGRTASALVIGVLSFISHKTFSFKAGTSSNKENEILLQDAEPEVKAPFQS
jgi:putative flippase GtrA